MQGMKHTHVEVARSGGYYTGYTWTLTFITPRGSVPTLSINTSTVIGQKVNGTVVKVQDGSNDILWFQNIPAYLTEVPLDIATKRSVRSNAEIYVRSYSGEFLKAVCDGARDSHVATSFIEGNETTCQYSFSTSASAVISGMGLFKVDQETTGVQIHGNYFDLAGPLSYFIQVTIAGHPCNVSSLNSTFILCYVQSVPWGKYTPVVDISGYGRAVLATNQVLSFKQSVYSISPRSGSFAGGQILTLQGRGFRPNATITIGSSLQCEIVEYTSSQIRCRTAPAPVFHSSHPSISPTAEPTRLPTVQPSAAPTEIPSFAPSELPTEAPSAAPSELPTYLPTHAPSERPSEAPTETPTVQTDSPTEVPSVAPTDSGLANFPSEAPTESPTESIAAVSHFTEDLNSAELVEQMMSNEFVQQNGIQEPWVLQQRKLTVDPELLLNSYQVSIDGMTMEDENLSSYTYSLDETPVISIVSPTLLSSAITYNVTLTGLFRPAAWNVSVTIGNQACEHVNMTERFLSCVLKRDHNFGSVRRVPVKVYIENLGFAASASDYLSLPVVSRGFELSAVVPRNGSIMGGNVVSVRGFGFLQDFPEKHSILLTAEGLSPLSEYATLLVSLGFNDQTTFYDEDAFVNCVPLSATFEELTCYLPGHVIPYNETRYDVLVTLNSVRSVCHDVTHNCSYNQLVAATPILFENVTVDDVSSLGEYTVRVGGLFLSGGVRADTIHFSVFGLPCEILELNASSALIRTAPIPMGTHLVNATQDGYGFFYSAASLPAWSQISQVSFDSSSGSFAGGTFFVVSGFGFSPDCEQNLVSLDIAFGDGTLSTVVVGEYMRCSTNSLQMRTPSTVSKGVHGDAIVTMVHFQLLNSTAPSSTFSLPTESFQYSSAGTPLVSVNATEGYTYHHLKISVQQIAGAHGIHTLFGQVDCLNNATSFTSGANIVQICTVPFLPASPVPYNLFVNVVPYGYAILSSTNRNIPTFKSKLRVYQRPLVVSSIEGGSNLTLSGSGFPADTEVLICGAKCTMNGTITATSFECTIPPKLTIRAVKSLQSQGIFNDYISTVTGTYFSSLNSPTSSVLAAASDERYDTYFSHYNKNCFVGISLPAGYAAQPDRLRFYPRIQYASYVGSIVFEGLPLKGSSYIPLAYSKTARSGWNMVHAMNNRTSWFTAFRYRALDTTRYSQCMLAEVEFLGTVAWINETCPIMVNSKSNNFAASAGSVLYDFANFTPRVTSVFPSNGSALGGEVVQIHGTGFGPGSVDVRFSGVECSVVSHSSTVITCITNPRLPENVETSSIKVLVSGKGYATVPDSVEYLYLDKWSALTSWKNQEPPVDGDVVWIPDGQVILLDVSTPKLAFLLIEGSLHVDRHSSINIDSYYIFILGGYLEVGTVDRPVEGNVTITLHGDRYKTIEIPMIGNKFIAVASKGRPQAEFQMGMHVSSRFTGELEVHGQKRMRTWTFVNHTAPRGSYNITTLEPVDFRPGEKIILTGNDLPSNGYGFEELTVAANIDNRYVYFTTPLMYEHTSFVREIEGRVIPMRCEIGLLSRNVIIQGDNDVSDGQLYGVHTIAFQSGIYHLENAEIRRCGQAFNFGRYCTHSHMAGNMEGSYVKANSIHNSYQRAVTTHDTRNWEVRDNVAFNVAGHAYFVEDGTEKENYLTGNLGVYILKSSALLKSDLKPAVFWTATPTNYWRDNVAVHSAKFGFWFEPVGSEDTSCPVHSYIGEHWNVTVHSNSDIGLRIYPQYTPLTDECGQSFVPSPQYIYHLLSYHNGGNGIFSKVHGDIHHMYPTLVENGGNEINIVRYENVRYTKNPAVQNALLVGTLPENYRAGINLGKLGIWTPQNEYFYIRNVTFVNYGTSGAIAGCNDCLGETMKQGAFTTRFEQLKFVNTELRIVWRPTYKEIMWDLDGTLAGVPDSMITMYYDVINWPGDCSVLSPVSTYSNSIRCGGNGSPVRLRRVQLDAVTPSQLSYTNVVVKSAVGQSSFFFLPMDTYGWVFPAVTGPNKNYSYIWADAGISAYTMNLTLGRIHLLKETINNTKYNEKVMITYTPNLWDYTPYSFATTYNGVTKYAPTNSTKPLTKMGEARFDNVTVSVLLTNQGAQMNQRSPFNVYAQAKLCPPRGCPIPPIPTLSTPMLWSKKNSWQSKKVPIAGQRVVIDSNMWIVLDITPPKLGCIVIYGKLSFQSNATYPKTLSLSTQCIQVYGTLEIMGENRTAFSGDASVILYGTKGSSLPVTMTEGVFLGSKVIAVGGNLTAIGEPKSTSWTRLHSTVHSNSSVVVLSEVVDWKVGDEVVISPTAYFNAQGNPWYTNTKTGRASDEIRRIKAITTVNGTFSRLVLNGSLVHTHLCENAHGYRFCGAVGVLTRNVRFLSQDSENPLSSSFGFGGHIQVFDMPKLSPPRLGHLQLVNVEMKNFGKINSDKYGVTLGFTTTTNHPAPVVLNCSFNSGYNFAVRTTNVAELTFSNNVVARNYGGGVLIDPTSINYQVDGNLIVGSRQLPSVLLSTFPWVRPIAGVTLENAQGTCRNNLVAGSEDQGFTVATSMFHVPRSMKSLCQTTSSLAYSYSQLANYKNSKFYGNEAVGGKGGLFVMAMGLQESSPNDCSVVDGFFTWRNAHTGIIAIDSVPNLLIHNVVLAENHIGVHMHFSKSALWAFSGIVNSTIINSLADNTVCGDLPDSLYLPGRQCHVWSTSDPLAQKLTCQSTLVDLYKRVGVLIPLFTNKPRTCTMSGAFTPCDPPNTPDRLCQMPWEKRYALPIPNLYSEFHLHDVNFVGFNTSSPGSVGSRQRCIPSTNYDRTAAVALNPTEYDTQPTIISSRLSWDRSNVNSRFGFEQGAWVSECQDNYPCTGQDQLIWHDLDGSMNTLTVPGQLYQKNPAFIAPFPQCLELPDMALNLYFCPTVVTTVDDSVTQPGFHQYNGLWDDSGPQVIQPIVTTRKFYDRNVSIASYGPQNDMCAMRFYYSQFNFLWADRKINRIVPTGTVPPRWEIRWDAPSEDNVMILEFFVQNSQVINVYVSDNGYDNFMHVKSQDTYPTFDDPAGTNIRDPQKRLLAVTVRGGAARFYRFVVVPVAAVTIKMDMTMKDFFSDRFIANMALLLSISPSRIKITSVRAGSVIADFEVSPAVTVANSSTAVASQVSELAAVTQNLSLAIVTGAIQTVLNVTVDQVFAVPPVVPVELNPVLDIPQNSSYNATKAREDLIALAIPQLVVLYTYPTSFPTGQPSSFPSSQPSGQPSGRPTGLPSSQPSSQPTHPTSRPTECPSSQPSSKPSAQPSTQPSSQPSGQPSRRPSSQPSSQPSRQPTGQPTRQPYSRPTGQPSRQPTSQPSRRPSAQPTSRPTRLPSSLPSSQPSAQPFSKPTGQPSGLPSSRPSRLPTSRPSSSPTPAPTPLPTCSPTVIPTAVPSAIPTATPTASPTAVPTASPSEVPTAAPSNIPTYSPTFSPTEVPSAVPSEIPTATPSASPTEEPSQSPTPVPSAIPTESPTELPSASPSAAPSFAPSAAPTEVPSAQPTTAVPTELPSESPTLAPSIPGPTETPTLAPTALPTEVPSEIPTAEPTTATPTVSPTTAAPSEVPTAEPSAVPSENPTFLPTAEPSLAPSPAPTEVPSESPTAAPSDSPTPSPTEAPTFEPTAIPTVQPSAVPTVAPSDAPSVVPSQQPSAGPSFEPSAAPSEVPTAAPSDEPSQEPTASPTAVPSEAPSATPTALPSEMPSEVPSLQPSELPTAEPTVSPSASPTLSPSEVPTAEPSAAPSSEPTLSPSASPTAVPSAAPSKVPSAEPSASPTAEPTGAPSVSPSVAPSAAPTVQPTPTPSSSPTAVPSAAPSEVPSVHPSAVPTAQPTTSPSESPSLAPSAVPSAAPSESPSEVPSAAPTEVPSAVPTIAPSAEPSAEPTLSPSSLPTRRPTPSPSTLRPTAFQSSPTFSPTGGTFTMVEIPCTQTFQGCTASEFQSDPAAVSQFEESVADTVASNDLGTPTVNITAVSDSVRRKLTTTSSVNIKYTVSFSLSSFQLKARSPSQVFAAFSAQLKDAVANGSLVAALQGSGLPLFQNVSSSLSDLAIANYSTHQVVIAGQNLDGQSEGSGFQASSDFITGVSIGGFFFLIILGFIYTNYLQKSRKHKRLSKVIPVVPMSEEGFTNINVDLERLNSPDVVALHRYRTAHPFDQKPSPAKMYAHEDEKNGDLSDERLRLQPLQKAKQKASPHKELQSALTGQRHPSEHLVIETDGMLADKEIPASVLQKRLYHTQIKTSPKYAASSASPSRQWPAEEGKETGSQRHSPPKPQPKQLIPRDQQEIAL